MSYVLLALLLADPAWAHFAEPMNGPYVDLAGGLGMGGRPIAPGPGWMGSFGWWFGRYDSAYAIGRYTSIGVNVRQDRLMVDSPHPPAPGRTSKAPVSALRTAPMLELRKGNDLIVAGLFAFLGGGPLLTAVEGETTVSATARAGVGGEFRRTRYLGFTLRLEGGADFGDEVGGVFAAQLGVQFSRPARRID